MPGHPIPPSFGGVGVFLLKRQKPDPDKPGPSGVPGAACYDSLQSELDLKGIGYMRLLPAILLGFATLATSQNPSAPAGPTPQQQVMGYFVGNWSLQGTTRISPSSPPASFTGKEQSAWTSGGYFVETHTDIHGPMGDVRSTRVMEYNPADKVYTYNVYNSLGEHIVAIGHLDGNVWTWKAEQKLNGVVTNARYTFNFVSKNSYTFKSEVESPKGGWLTVMQGTATRVQ